MSLARPTSLAALKPAPCQVAADRAPPWPPPALRVRSPTPMFADKAGVRLILAVAFGVLAAVSPNWIFFGALAATSLGFVIAMIHALVLASREYPAQLAAHAEHVRRAELTWARIVDAEIVGERRGQHGVVRHYELVVQLAVWPRTSADAPALVSHRFIAPATAGASVVPGAYLGVLHDPVDHRIVPQSLATRDGAQLPL